MTISTKTSLRNMIVGAALAASPAAWGQGYFVLDWDKIEHWTGSGSNRCALIVQFNNVSDPRAHVWGFRWDDDDFDGGIPTGEDLFRAVAAGSDDLYLFTQYTGWMGSTVCGIGYFDPSGDHLANHLSYDFAAAKDDSKVSFDYFSPNTTMGQTSAPGNFTTVYCNRAIQQSATTNILEHPLNAREYGYPAYDYDHWLFDGHNDGKSLMIWASGWYDGYWSYWVGGVDSDDLSYSGLGMTSRKISDGQVDVWSFTVLDRNSQSYGEAVTPGELPLDYSHVYAAQSSGVEAVGSDATATDGKVYTLSGCSTPYLWPAHRDMMPQGVYIVVSPDGTATKVTVNQH